MSGGATAAAGRLRVALVVASLALATGRAGARAEVAAFGSEPPAGCATVYDVTHDVAGGDAALDIVGLTLRVTDTQVFAYVETAAPLSTATTPAYRVEVALTAPGKKATLYATGYQDESSPAATQDATARTGGGSSPGDVVFLRHPTRPLVAFAVDRAHVASGVIVEGATIHVTARTYAIPPKATPSTLQGASAATQYAGIADETANGRVVVGEAGCFAPGWAPPRPLPIPGCAQISDAVADATALVVGAGPSPVVPSTTADPATEIEWVAATTDGDRVRFVVKVAKVGEPASAPTLDQEVRFRIGDGAAAPLAVLRAQHVAGSARVVRDGPQAVNSTYPNTFGDAAALYDDTSRTAIVAPARVQYSTVTNTVTLDFAMAEANEYETLNKRPLFAAGTVLRDVTVSFVEQVATASTVSSGDTAGDAGTNYVVGDRHCFQPPPAHFASATPKTARYGDAVRLAATLRSSTDAARSGKPVTIAYGGQVMTATTDAVGAVALPAVARGAGRYPLTFSFAGDDDDGPASLTVSLVVSARPTRLSLAVTRTGASRTVRAVLVDDRARPLGGRRVTWTVNGHAAGAATTDARGAASLKGVASGARVIATFAGVVAQYMPTSATVRST